MRDYFPLEGSAGFLQLYSPTCVCQQKVTADVKKSFTGTAKDTLHL
ncbi:hypothetical protein [uncultured Phascolarctobacterium sp.]|nr:hypothetical protein [uncultured Phascolarctobacterium sp.]